MKNKNNYYTKDELDLTDLVRTLWREKILILSFSAICTILAFFFLKPEEYKTIIHVKSPNHQIFNFYTYPLLNLEVLKSNELEIHQNFEKSFNLNFLSKLNVEKFIQQRKDLDYLKIFSKQKNIFLNQSFENLKFGEVREGGIKNKYFLVFPKDLDGQSFLNDYVEFIKFITITEIKDELKSKIELHIEIAEINLALARKVNFKLPEAKQSDLFLKYNVGFYDGEIILSQKILILKNYLLKLDIDKFEYDHFYDKASLPIAISKYSLLFTVLGGFVTGFFLSLMFIFLKNFLKK